VSIRASFFSLAVLTIVAAAGCQPRIGDGCGNSQNCSINGDRLCDNSQPGGYCLVFDCQPDACPDDAVCVRFNDDEPRHAIVACMRRCGGDGDCRADQGYRCRNPEQLMGIEENLDVEVIDRGRPNASFCIATE
jgi:hypothetical protein